MINLNYESLEGQRDAFGSADEIPKVLSILFSNPSMSEVGGYSWDYLWGCLCHQSSIYSASLAAVPLIINVGVEVVKRHIQIDHSFINLPVEIEKLRPKHPHLKVDENYYNTFRKLNDLVDEPITKYKTLSLDDLKEAKRLLVELNLRSVKQNSDLGPLFE